MAKISKRTLKKGHRIAKAILRKGAGRVRNPYAVGVAQAIKSMRRRRR
jgi:hypothetical protein